MAMDEKDSNVKDEEVIEKDVLKTYKNKDTKGDKEVLKERFYHGSKKTKHQMPKKSGK
jgi:hypothetical protein